ncbi:2879_t:CDS:2, partial [Gigaspora rosea]
INNVETSPNVQTIEPNNQDNEDLTEPNIHTIELSDQNVKESTNLDFQTRIPLSAIQTSTVNQTRPGIY